MWTHTNPCKQPLLTSRNKNTPLQTLHPSSLLLLDNRFQLFRLTTSRLYLLCTKHNKKGKGSSYSITKHRVPELIPVLGSQLAADVSQKPGGRLPLLSARPAITLATLKRAATNFAAWWTEARWVWTVCLRLLPDSVTAAIWTRALLHVCPAC